MDVAGLMMGIILGLCFLLVANSKKQLVPSKEDEGPSASWLEDTGAEVNVQGSWMHLLQLDQNDFFVLKQLNTTHL